MRNRVFTTRNMVMMAIYAALASVLFAFPHIHTPFGFLLEIEFSDVPVFLAAFYMHPVCAVVVALVKTLIHLGLTETGGIGEAITLVQALVCLIPFFFFRRKNGRPALLVKTMIAAVLDVFYGMAAGMAVIRPFLTEIPAVGPLALFAVFFAIRGLIIAFTTCVLGFAVHNVMTAQHPPFFLHERRAKNDKIDLGKSFVSRSLRDTNRFAAAVAATVKDGDVLELVGDLGAGKTAFTKGLGKVFGIPPDRILSPTFVLCKTYDEGSIRLHHADLYRVRSAEEAAEAGILEHIGDGLFVVEWADPIRAYLPPHRAVCIRKGEGEQRIFEVKDV